VAGSFDVAVLGAEQGKALCLLLEAILDGGLSGPGDGGFAPAAVAGGGGGMDGQTRRRRQEAATATAATAAEMRRRKGREEEGAEGRSMEREGRGSGRGQPMKSVGGVRTPIEQQVRRL
jgi:hypothetical protein